MCEITIFSGNRAEYGILYPIIEQLSKEYEVNLLLSGAHVIRRWNTMLDVAEQLQNTNCNCKVELFTLSDYESQYIKCLSTIYDKSIKYFIENLKIKFAIVLGDRIETFAFALAAFYSRIPLIHICGGDVVNVPNFDTNVRHSISKLASFHWVTNDLSRQILIQLGEEKQRIVNIGNPSFDYDRLDMLSTRENLSMKYGISENDYLAIATFHPLPMKSARDNYDDFLKIYDGILQSKINKIIFTYANNDPGHEMILECLERIKCDNRVKVVRSLGTYNYLGLMKHFKTIIVGNSSSGLLETSYFLTPTINIGERQNSRVRGNNVFDCSVDASAVKQCIDFVIHDYQSIKDRIKDSQFIFGNGKAAIKASKFIRTIFDKDQNELLFKKFIIR